MIISYTYSHWQERNLHLLLYYYGVIMLKNNIEKDIENQAKPEKRKISFAEILILYFGAALFVGGVVTLALTIFKISFFKTIPVIVLFIGLLFFLIVYTGKRTGKNVFLGFFFCFSSVLLLLTQWNLVPFSLEQLWPLFLILISLSMVMVSLLCKRKFELQYLIPAGMICVLGIFFTLFSFDIIPTPLNVTISAFWPLLLVLGGLLLIAIYFRKRKQYQNTGEDSTDNE